MSAAKTSKKKSNPLVPRMMIDGFERDIQESYIRERAPEILETLLIDRTMTAADSEGRVHRIRWCTDDYGFAADAEIDPELISKPDLKIIRPRVDKRPTFDEHGRKVGPKTSEVGQKFANVEAKGTEAGQKTAEIGQKNAEVGAKGKKLGANPAEVGAKEEEVKLLCREGRGKGSNRIAVPEPSQPITKPLEPRTKARKPITKRRVSAKKGKEAK